MTCMAGTRCANMLFLTKFSQMILIGRLYRGGKSGEKKRRKDITWRE